MLYIELEIFSKGLIILIEKLLLNFALLKTITKINHMFYIDLFFESLNNTHKKPVVKTLIKINHMLVLNFRFFFSKALTMLIEKLLLNSVLVKQLPK